MDLKKKVAISEKTFFGSDTKIGPWFQFPIPKPGFVVHYEMSFVDRSCSILRHPMVRWKATINFNDIALACSLEWP
jgi:hypothetical protein